MFPNFEIFLLYLFEVIFQGGIWLLVYCFEWNYVDKTKNKIQDNDPYPRVGIGILKTVQTNTQAPVSHLLMHICDFGQRHVHLQQK